ncbi:hypothetical protein [Natronoglycomyces albus]|uniref:Uncharacterized protein n=1 Tax=Natronoglycomyces albus TaxID=2811108 RepID=A0A895XET0_9ACTN|nr:hypothetical protein [Natronoglycomyces albus]QSB04341.1 hypothetical protein JQS30_11100 [Natronoglycomyces albus]
MRLPHPFAAACEELGLSALLSAQQLSASSQGLLKMRDSLSPQLGLAVDMLCLGRTVSLDAAQDTFGPNLVDWMGSTGLATVTDSSIQLPNRRLVGHLGRLVFVGPAGSNAHGYYGPDSVGLGKLLLNARGRCLDLFASTGAQSVLMARSGDEVDAVEINRELKGVFELNTAINGCDDRVTALWGDALRVELTGPYDTVSLNAPLFPSFGIEGVDQAADGGATGNSILRQALKRCELTDHGRIFSTMTTVGSPGRPELDWLAQLCRQLNLAFQVIPTGIGRLDGQSRFSAELVDTLAESSSTSADTLTQRLRAHWDTHGIDRLFFCLLVGGRATGSKATVTVLSNFEGGRGWWIG